ncbi:MAG TPA: carboxypeptidase-like regulatory domain-containing protein [Polyangiaceae bacterium]|nr:carboxypeptidase-like regulatory domain-containing protein [Polyangiaceae bacterium]
MRTFFVRFAIFVGAAAVATAPLACHKQSSDGASGEGTGASAPAVDGAASAAASAPAPFPIPRASVDLVLNPEGLPPYAGPTGSVEGTVTVDGPPSPNVAANTSQCPAALETYGKLFREGKADSPNGPRPLADAVVVVVGYTGFYLPDRSDAVKITITPSCAYPARTIAITYGQRLDITNQSRLLFAPAIDESMSTAIMVAPPQEKGEPVRLYPDKAGYFTLTDHMERYVKEDLYVFRHPLHAVTDAAGHYRVDGVPVGKLKVGVHHPTVDADAEAPVDVAAGVATKVDLTLTYKPKVKPPLDGGAPTTKRCLRWLDPATKLKCAEYDRPND